MRLSYGKKLIELRSRYNLRCGPDPAVLFDLIIQFRASGRKTGHMQILKKVETTKDILALCSDA